MVGAVGRAVLIVVDLVVADLLIGTVHVAQAAGISAVLEAVAVVIEPVRTGRDLGTQ